MMNEFSPEEFFDVAENPEAAGLFKEVRYIWEAVGILPAYIERIIEPAIWGDVEEGAWLESGRVRLEEGARVERGAIVRGPTIIGRNTVVRSGAYIRGHLLVGADCLIGAGTETRQLLMLNHSNIPHRNFFVTSLVGNRVNVGGATDAANVLLDGKAVEIRITRADGTTTSYPTGMTNFGAVIGDDTKLGGQILLQPGTVVGKRCRIYPQCTISGYIPHDSSVKPMTGNLSITSRI
jgi:NDP-sugar pyrophosphorylase family protein